MRRLCSQLAKQPTKRALTAPIMRANIHMKNAIGKSATPLGEKSDLTAIRKRIDMELILRFGRPKFGNCVLCKIEAAPDPLNLNMKQYRACVDCDIGAV